MVMNMTTKRSLPIFFLTLALVVGSVALAHAPPPSQPPVIGTPIINPTSPAFGDAVTVSVNVTSARSTIKNVTLPTPPITGRPQTLQSSLLTMRPPQLPPAEYRPLLQALMLSITSSRSTIQATVT